jgi:hypothetical protein
LIRRANSAVPASTASRIRNIWNLASTVFNPVPGQFAHACGAVNPRIKSG